MKLANLGILFILLCTSQGRTQNCDCRILGGNDTVDVVYLLDGSRSMTNQNYVICRNYGSIRLR